jgi:hypothetical protein
MQDEPRNSSLRTPASRAARSTLFWIARFSARNSTGRESFARIPPTRAAARKTYSGRSCWKKARTAASLHKSSSQRVLVTRLRRPEDCRARTSAEPTRPGVRRRRSWQALLSSTARALRFSCSRLPMLSTPTFDRESDRRRRMTTHGRDGSRGGLDEATMRERLSGRRRNGVVAPRQRGTGGSDAFRAGGRGDEWHCAGDVRRAARGVYTLQTIRSRQFSREGSHKERRRHGARLCATEHRGVSGGGASPLTPDMPMGRARCGRPRTPRSLGRSGPFLSAL